MGAKVAVPLDCLARLVVVDTTSKKTGNGEKIIAGKSEDESLSHKNATSIWEVVQRVPNKGLYTCMLLKMTRMARLPRVVVHMFNARAFP